jgi:hypothetical protein
LSGHSGPAEPATVACHTSIRRFPTKLSGRFTAGGTGTLDLQWVQSSFARSEGPKTRSLIEPGASADTGVRDQRRTNTMREVIAHR